MIETIALTLAKTLISFMFEQHLEHIESVKIEGAPRWYYQQTTGHICNSGFATGGFEAINLAKKNARSEMESRINKSIQAVIYNNYRELDSAKEKMLVKQFSHDENLSTFVESRVIYENIKYETSIKTGFVRVCIDKPTLSSYQSERASKIAKEITLHHKEKALQRLEQALK